MTRTRPCFPPLSLSAEDPVGLSSCEPIRGALSQVATTLLPRVLVVHSHYRQRGGEDAAFGAHVDLLRGAGLEVATLESRNDELTSVQAVRRTFWSGEGCRMVRDAVRTHGSDVVHFHNVHPNLSLASMGAARAEGAAVVATLHNFRPVCAAGTLFRDGQVCTRCVGATLGLDAVRHRCFRGSFVGSAAVSGGAAFHRLRGTWHRDVDVLVALSNAARAVLSDGGLPEDRMEVLPNFVVDRGVPTRPERDGVLFVGRLTEEKGVRLLLEAARAVPEGATITIAGDGPLQAEVRTVAEQIPRVRWLGAVSPSAVRSLMERASALWFPSLWFEGMPLTILEAFGAGLPVIASELGAMVDLVTTGRNGQLLPSGDVQAWTRWLREFDSGGFEGGPLGSRARQDYESEFTPEVHLRRLIDLYRRAVARRQEVGS